MTRSRTLLIMAFGTFAAWATAAPAWAQDTTGGAPSNNHATGSQPSSAMVGQLITASAKVEKVNPDKRELTLKSDKDDKPFTINVPEGVTRLENVKPGDKLRVSFYESVAVSLAKPGEAQPSMKSSTSTSRTRGTLPGGGVAQQITTNAKITKVAPTKDELTIEGPGGATTIKVDDPQVQAQLGRLKVGDRIQTTYTQAMATSITPARSM
jgi:Cu/Ag efflux protein CusF